MSERFKFSKAFPSPYIREPDLQGKHVTMTISGWRYIDPKKDKGDDGRPMKGTVIKFDGSEKELVVNVTNYRTISQLHGLDPDDWSGKQITLYPTTCRFGNDPNVPCIRVKI